MYRAVVVDDEPYAREGMRILIDWEHSGFRLLGEASDGPSALRLIHEERPDLVFLDIQLPGMDGTALASTIRDRYPDMLIAFLSGHSRFDYARAAIQVQAFCYLLKPIDPEQVERELCAAASTLSERAQRSSAEENAVIAAMHAYIREEYARKPSLAGLARRMNLHPGYLGGKIKKLSGSSFLTHLTRWRIDQAKTLLLTTDKSIKSIAISVGMPDVDYFSHRYKQITGQTPGEYRRTRSS